jgi:hypothetical protein
MRLKQYSSDLSVKGWQVIQKVLHVQRKSKWNLQEIVDIFDKYLKFSVLSLQYVLQGYRKSVGLAFQAADRR